MIGDVPVLANPQTNLYSPARNSLGLVKVGPKPWSPSCVNLFAILSSKIITFFRHFNSENMDVRHVFEGLQQSLENKTLLSNVQTIIHENIKITDEDLKSLMNWLELLRETTVRVLQITGNLLIYQTHGDDSNTGSCL